MSKIEIIVISDHNNCDQCGGGYEDGGVVKINGKVVFEHVPRASCFDNKDVTTEDLLVEALKALGHEVEFSYDDLSGEED